MAASLLVLLFLVSQFLFQGISFIGRQPVCFSGPIRQMQKNQDSQDHCRNAPGDVHPLPALHSQECRVMDRHVAKCLRGADPEQEVGELGTDELRDRRGNEEPGQGTCTVTAGKPVGQVHDHPREKPSLGQAREPREKLRKRARPRIQIDGFRIANQLNEAAQGAFRQPVTRHGNE